MHSHTVQAAADITDPGGSREGRWSAGMWLATLTLFGCFYAFEHDFYTSTYPDYVLDAEIREQWAEGGNRGRQLGTLIIAALGGVGLLLPGPRRLRWAAPLMVLGGAYLMFAAASVSWSIDPSASQRRLLVLGLMVVGILGLAKQLSWRMLPEITMVILFGFLLVGLAAELSLGTFRPWSGMHRFAGTAHPNTMGRYMAALGLASWCVFRQGGRLRPVGLIVFVLAIVFLLLTRSRTALASFVFASAFVIALGMPRWRSLSLLWGVLWVGSAGGLSLALLGLDLREGGQQLLTLGREAPEVEQVASLTGRWPLWERLWDYVRERPLVGYGYEAFWTPEHFAEVALTIVWAPADAHSSYIECLLDLGLIGLAMMVLGMALMFVQLSWQAARSGDTASLFALAHFLCALVFSVTEAGLQTPSTAMFLLGLAVANVLLTREQRLPRTRRPTGWRRGFPVATGLPQPA
jgi:O-antigen ligase